MEAAELILGATPNNERCLYSLDGMLTAHAGGDKTLVENTFFWSPS